MSSPSPRHVLVLAYFFPPLGGAGVQRTLKFVKYLSELGWRATVITTRSRSYNARDETLLGELPAGTRVIRAPDPPFARWASMVFDHFGLNTLRALAAWPDPAVLWLPGALFAALRVARRDRPDVVYSSAPYFSAHMVASALTRRMGIPWVADFRDEWAGNPYVDRAVPLQRLDTAVERRVMRRASRVVGVADYFELAVEAARRTTIPNGVDEDDLTALDGVVPSADRFSIAFVGTLFGDRDAAPVVAALRRLGERGRIDAARCELRVVGSMWLADSPDAGSIEVVTTGYVPHDAALREMGSASALLLYASSTSPAPSGKLFEYLAAERPILCVARRDNLAWKLVEGWDAGVCAEPDDAAGIETAIATLYDAWLGDGARRPAGVRARVLECYSRRVLARDLDAVLDAAVRGEQPA